MPLLFAALSTALTTARATVSVTPLYGNNMVIQRGKTFPVWGTAVANKTITITYNSQTTNTTSDAQGNWQVSLPAMSAKTNGSNFSITEAGGSTITLANVVVGDVWLCSGQSNMEFGLNGCDRQSDIDSANFPGIREFYVPPVWSGSPTKSLTGGWSVCSPGTAGGFGAVGFYFARKIYQDQGTNIPIGLLQAPRGATAIDPWLAPEGASDVSVLQPLYSQSILPYGPFSLFNGTIYPLAPYDFAGAIWYQGESRETTYQSTDSYFLKEKALAQGWKRLWGMDDLPLYVVLLAAYTSPPAGTNVAPDMPGTTWADTRIQQMNVLGLPHGGVASAIDVGDAGDIHPKDKLDVGERLALWALRNEYGRSTIVPSGPVLTNVTVAANKAICSFDYLGAGLMVGSKTPYLPTQETNVPLARFSIAGASGAWYDATAVINGSTVELTSPSVTTPVKVAYACWNNPSGANLYNRDGLPAAPFYVDAISAKYTITASAGTGGSISPSGVTTYLKRKTAFYTIKADTGYYIQDVTVDGASVGSVETYTFDPVYANHTIAATFVASAPNYTIHASAGAGGSFSSTGTVSVVQGAAKTFNLLPNTGAQVLMVTVDGVPVGNRTGFTFADVRTNHTISATFVCPITAAPGYGGSISPVATTLVPYGSNQSFTITANAGYALSDVKVDGVSVGTLASYTFTNVTTAHTLSATFSGGAGSSGYVPRIYDLLFSSLTDTFPASGNTGNWATYLPSGKTLTAIATPAVDVINGVKWERNLYADGDGYDFGTYSLPINCLGATIVLAVKPTRNGISSGWNSCVDAFYDRLVLGIKNNSGLVCVRRNGSLDTSATAIPDGQITILSIVVQSTGQYKAYANGVKIMDVTSTSDMTSLVPGIAGTYASDVTVGRNWPDAWTTFNGGIGDVYFYTIALPDGDRQQLEAGLTSKFSGSGTNYTINASAGTGGAIAPSGAVLVVSNANQTFTITPNTGYAASQVIVDSVNRSAATSYTFTNVVANHTILVTFTNNGGTNYTINASAGTGGTITPSGAILVSSGASQAFAIAPNGGYQIAGVQADGVSQGALAAWTFTNVIANHTIAAAFSLITNGIPSASKLLFSVVTDSLPGDGLATGNWAPYLPTNGPTFTKMGAPTVKVLNGRKWVNNHYSTGDGFDGGMFSSLATAGASFVMAFKPARNAQADSWQALVDLGTWGLTVGIRNNTGGITVFRKGTQYEYSTGAAIIPDGQTTILSCIFQEDGSFKIYANGVQTVNNTTTTDQNLPLNPVVPWYAGSAQTNNWASHMNLGRTEGAGWASENGYIGDVFVYTNALSDAERQQLEANLTVKFINYTITASAGTGGTISPSGAVSVSPGANQSFTIAPLAGYAITNVTVDGLALGALSSYTFTNIAALHSINAAFRFLPMTPPMLAIAANGSGGLDITWSDAHTNQLQWTPTLGAGAAWNPVGGSPAHVGGLYKVTVTPGARAAFYGLSP